ncbi:MAG: hypothetical protein AAGC93_24570 [Cyanobacteria bacterium P01_F01_bin.53]
MVAVVQHAQPRTGLPYLKPCQPASGIATFPGGTSRKLTLQGDPFDRPAKLSKRRGRLLGLLFGITQAAAVGLGLWTATLEGPMPPPATTINTSPISRPQVGDELWQFLGSEDFTELQRAAKENALDKALVAAEQERSQAQQLRLDAEAQAIRLTDEAARQAQATTSAAVRQADLIHLDTTYIGAEQVVYGKPGDTVTLKFPARIQCKDGSFGETAVASPVDARIEPREVRNLGVCYPSSLTAAGEPIGEVGEWGVAFFKRE